jgi:hypothetical protein
VQIFRTTRSRVAMPLFAGLIAAAISGQEARAQPATGSGAGMFGIGKQTCSTALQSHYAALSVGWALGYFSAINVVNARNHAVGRSVGDKGILERVKQECETNSSEAFALAISKVYDQLEKAGQ